MTNRTLRLSAALLAAATLLGGCITTERERPRHRRHAAVEPAPATPTPMAAHALG